MTIAYATETSTPSDRSNQGSPALAHAYQHARSALWSGRVLSGLFVAFMLMDAVMKVLQAPEAVKGTTELGYPASVIVPLGVVQLLCLALYLLPRSALLGAVLWTGYLGGAIATHVRLEHSLFGHILFPVYVAAFMWGGLWLRDARVRAMLASR